MAIVKESLADEVENFASSAWPGEVLLDEKMAWFAALGGGQVNQQSVAGFVAKLANPWSRLRANFKALKTSSKSGNLKGEGLITGGKGVDEAQGLVRQRGPGCRGCGTDVRPRIC